MGECQQQKHTQHAPSTKTECNYLYGWIKKRSHMQNSPPSPQPQPSKQRKTEKKVNPRAIAGNAEEEAED